MTTGLVETINTDWRGDTLAATVAAGVSVLPVSSVVDFDDEAGGWLVVGDSAPLAYTGADEDASTVTLAAPLAAGYEAGTPVNLWDPTVSGGGSKVVEYVATVELHDDSGAVDAVIPHATIPTSGLEYLIGASVRIGEAQDGEWYVDEVLGREVQLDGDLIDLVGRTITGAIIRTSDTGNRIEILTDSVTGELRFYSGDVAETTPAKIVAVDPGTEAPQVQVTSGTTSVEGVPATLTMGAGATTAASAASITAGRIQLGIHANAETHVGDETIGSGRLVVHGRTDSRNVYITSAPDTSNAANVRIAADGQLQRVTSTRRVKAQIATLDLDPEALLSLIPRTFVRKDEAGEESPRRYVGFIAEEAADLGLEQWITRDENGTPDSFEYPSWPVAQQAILRSFADRLDAIERALGLPSRH